MTQDLTQASAAGLAKLYAKGRASPVETMKAVLARAEKMGPRINALCRIDTAQSLAAARASEKRWRKGKPLSPLDGVPVSIKELVRVKGWPHSMGSKLSDKTPADADAPAVARLREAGAIVFAQSTSSEYGHKGVTDSPLHGVSRNPWNANTGPMARTALDCALMMNVLARPDARDPFGLPADGIDYAKKLGGKLNKLRVGFVLRFGDHPLDIEVAAMVTRAARQFEALGCKVEDVEAPFSYPEAGRAFVIHWLAALQRLLQLYPESRHDEFDPNLLAGAKAGLRYSLQDMVNAQVTRRELAIAWNLFFAKYDLLLTPTVAVKPFAAGKNLPDGPDGKPNIQWSPYTSQFNLTRHPAATVPCGLSSEGLPVGLQIVSGHYRDALVLSAAARYAEAHPLKFPVLPETNR